MYVNVKRIIEYYQGGRSKISYDKKLDNRKMEMRLVKILSDYINVSEPTLRRKYLTSNITSDEKGKIVNKLEKLQIACDKSILFIDIPKFLINEQKSIDKVESNSYFEFLEVIARGQCYIINCQMFKLNDDNDNDADRLKITDLNRKIGQCDLSKYSKDEMTKVQLNKVHNISKVLNITEKSLLNIDLLDIVSLDKYTDEKYVVLDDESGISLSLTKESIKDKDVKGITNPYFAKLFKDAELYFLERDYKMNLSRLEHILVYIINKDIKIEDLKNYKKNKRISSIKSINDLKKEIKYLHNMICGCQIMKNIDDSIVDDLRSNQSAEEVVHYFANRLDEYNEYYEDKGVYLLENLYLSNKLDDILKIYDLKELF